MILLSRSLWLAFGMIRRYLAFTPDELRRIYNMLDHAAEGFT